MTSIEKRRKHRISKSHSLESTTYCASTIAVQQLQEAFSLGLSLAALSVAAVSFFSSFLSKQLTSSDSLYLILLFTRLCSAIVQRMSEDK